MIDGFYARPLIPLFFAFAIGITGGLHIPGYAPVVHGCVVAFILFILFLFFKSKPAFLSPLILFFSLGYLAIHPWADPVFPDHHITKYASRKWTIAGTVETITYSTIKPATIVLQSETLTGSDPEAPIPVTGRIRLLVKGPLPDISPGDRICFTGKIKSPRNYYNPGGFDYERFLAFENIRATSFAWGDQIGIVAKSPQPLSIKRFRLEIIRWIDTVLSGQTAAIIKALITGDKADIPPDVRDRFNAAGVSHILAVSGLHIGIVAGVSFFCFYWLASRFQYLLFMAWARKIAALSSLIPILFYGYLTGMSPSTIRAVAMVSVIMLALCFDKDHDLYNVLAIAATVILIIHPPSLFSVSFQFSFIAVFFIITGMSAIKPLEIESDTLHSFSFRCRRRFFEFMAVSFFALIGAFPLSLYYFNTVSFAALISNCVIIPIMGFGVVPAGLMAVLIYPVHENTARRLLTIDGNMTEIALKIVDFLSGVAEPAILHFRPNLLEIGCFYIIILTVFYIRYLNTQEKAVPFQRYAATAMIAVACMMLLSDAAYWVYRRYWRQTAELTVLDVGQGHCSLVELPRGRCILADGGGFFDHSVFDVGKHVVAPFLRLKKIRTIDIVILSHPHSDHLNGLLYILENFTIGEVWSNHERIEDEEYRKFIEIISSKHIPHPPLRTLFSRRMLGPSFVQAVYPPVDFLEKAQQDSWRDANHNSLAVKITFGNNAILLPGDLMARSEAELVTRANGNLKSDVLIAPHHGSKTSNTEKFIEAVDPKIVVIPAGWNNIFHFPHPEVINAYTKRNTAIYVTNIDGAVKIVFGKHRITVTPFSTAR